MKTIVETSPASSPLARGERLRQARKLARLTLKAMSETGDINFNTLCGWEIGRHSGLTVKGAKKVVDCLAREGIDCALNWLLHGIGDPPSTRITHMISPALNEMTEFLPKQIEVFQLQYPDFLSVILPDNTMLPHYAKGDFVAGKPLPIQKLKLANGKVIIAKLANDEVLVRQLIIDTATGTCSLMASNASLGNPLLFDVRIREWSVILCHLKYDPIYAQVTGEQS